MDSDLRDYRKQKFQQALNYGNVFFRHNPNFSRVEQPFMLEDDIRAGVYIVREFELDHTAYNSPYARAAGLINHKERFPKRDSRSIVTYYSLDDLFADGWIADPDVRPR